MVNKNKIIKKVNLFNKNKHFHKYKYGCYFPLNTKYSLREKNKYYYCLTTIERETTKAVHLNIKANFEGIEQTVKYWIPKSLIWKEDQILCVSRWFIEKNNIPFSYNDK
ncbi:hypothetical protein BX659_1513 [Orenia metallireducens]|jgi:hypothetical protein|uniref:Uncharacterized protein n=1 Tax=Orenia metallireducens TaxID=1413210 RepID=A0A285IHK7_9FIRM|nr:hypothetical protein [Orenia metallireducens]PRX17484.1 hypothetical protein BX659_1513 [Orenia metallireducens]SNY47442.1 hypothetical protein SAMN06265827_1517 [Orenia metallireducens]